MIILSAKAVTGLDVTKGVTNPLQVRFIRFIYTINLH